ncbi:hypothetical protein BG004_006086 [Podila humilis]|nr:hypothetical protein BG004_006086 [Podila humilis]
MTLKIASALVLLALAAQSAPFHPGGCVGSACDQSASSGNVDVGSTTNISPVTNVTPITNYQPIVQAHAPIVSSDCYDHGIYGGYGDYIPYGGAGGYHGSDYIGRGGLYGNRWARLARYGVNRPGLFKRQETSAATDQTPAQQAGSLLFSQFQSSPSQCPAGDTACIANLPQQTVDLGSSVSAVPETNIQPSTTYQSRVQSLDSNIQAAPAEQSSLPQQAVNLGYNTVIQPTTQPTVNQLTTDIQAAPAQDQSLPQSSVQLGSSVNIAPSVTVQPLTTFQPSIQSLPFIINAAPCVDTSAFAGTSASSVAAEVPMMQGAAAFQGQSDTRFQGMPADQSMIGMQTSSAPIATAAAPTCA